jgi:hypothetical protein
VCWDQPLARLQRRRISRAFAKEDASFGVIVEDFHGLELDDGSREGWDGCRSIRPQNDVVAAAAGVLEVCGCDGAHWIIPLGAG